MRYLIKTPMNARLESSESVVIFIPEGEEIETAPESGDVTVHLVWRGQLLNAESSVLRSSAVPKKSLQHHI